MKREDENNLRIRLGSGGPEITHGVAEQYVLALFDLYDELFELNMTKNRYRILSHVENKYVIPSVEGAIDAMISEVAENMIHPDDKELFYSFFVPEDVIGKFEAGAGKLVVEFRKKLESGGYSWAQITLTKPAVSEDYILLCYILDIDERKKTEEKNAALRQIFDSAVRDEYKCFHLVDVGSGFYERYAEEGLFGGEKAAEYEEAIRLLSEKIHPEDRSAFLEGLSISGLLARLENPDSSVLEFRIFTESGPRWVLNKVALFKNDKNKILSSYRDIHTLRTAEHKNRLISDKFLKAFGSIYMNIMEFDPVTGEAEILKETCMTHGVGARGNYGNFISNYCEGFIFESDREFLRKEIGLEALKEFADSGKAMKSIEVRCLINRKNYEWVEVSAFAAADSTEGGKRIVVTVRNVNEEKLLKKIVSRFVYENSDYFMYIDALKDEYVLFGRNEGISSLVPVSDSYSVVCKKYNERYVAADDLERVMTETDLDFVRRRLEEKDEHILYCGIIDPNRGYTRKKLRFVYFDKNNAVILLTRTDVTHMYEEEKRKNQRLVAALEDARTANRAKTDFLSRMSHDIRTPMNAIIGMTAIAGMNLEDREKVRDCLAKIGTSSQYLLSIINDILDMSKIESGKMVINNNKFNFIDFVGNVSSMMLPQARERGINFETDLLEPLGPYYVGDFLRLNQILMNLLSNSLKYTDKGGRILLGVRELSRSEKTARVEFVVKDTGSGMSEEFMKIMYEPFEQENRCAARDQIGSGLGLAIVRNLVKLMGGEVNVESKLGVGTVFTVTLELEIAQDRLYPGREEKEKIFSGLRVLVADGSKPAREHVSHLLKSMKIRSELTSSSEEALSAAENALTQGDPFNAAMIDLGVPESGGVELVRKLREIMGDSALIIILTSSDWTAVEKEARVAGADAFLLKPLFMYSISDVFIRTPALAENRSKEYAKRGRFAGQRVLLVEDNEMNVEIARTLLEYENLKVETARDGREAVNMFQSSAEGYYDLILMDIRMPVMDGLEATRAVRESGRGDARVIPVIAMSANAFQEDVELALQAGVNDYLVKPLDISRFYSVLSKLI